jgi:glutamate synthase (NADPH/NADH) large chain
MDEDKRAFYEYHASLMEPWDGPAAIAFTDGRVIGATLDRNGLRPGRYIVTKDDLVVLASEAGVLECRRRRAQEGPPAARPHVPGGYGAEAHHLRRRDQEAAGRPPALRQVAQGAAGHARSAAGAFARDRSESETLLRRQRAFGYSEEDLKILLGRWPRQGRGAGRLDGHRYAAGLPLRPPQPLFNYFKQLFRAGHQSAHRSHPRRDGDVADQLHRHRAQHSGRDAEHCHTLKLPHPILTNRDLEKLRRVSSGDLLATTLPTLFRAEDGEAGLKHSLDDLPPRLAAIKSGYTLLILSDRGVDPTYAPIPSLLAMAAVHNHLVREKTRTQVALIIESGEPREVMHFALLIGYGASAINPYLAIETLHDLKRRGLLPHNVTGEKR